LQGTAQSGRVKRRACWKKLGTLTYRTSRSLRTRESWCLSWNGHASIADYPNALCGAIAAAVLRQPGAKPGGGFGAGLIWASFAMKQVPIPAGISAFSLATEVDPIIACNLRTAATPFMPGGLTDRGYLDSARRSFIADNPYPGHCGQWPLLFQLAFAQLNVKNQWSEAAAHLPRCELPGARAKRALPRIWKRQADLRCSHLPLAQATPYWNPESAHEVQLWSGASTLLAPADTQIGQPRSQNPR